MKRGESRARLIEAARAEFGTHGFSGARIDRIAKRASLNKQLIYYYFGSKTGLHTAVTADTEAAAPNPKDGASPGDVRQALSDLVAGLGTRPDLVALCVDRSPGSSAARQARAWLVELQGTFAGAVARGQGMGYFRDDVDPGVVARQAVVLCLGFVALRRHLDASEDLWVREVGDTLLRAIAW